MLGRKAGQQLSSTARKMPVMVPAAEYRSKITVPDDAGRRGVPDKPASALKAVALDHGHNETLRSE